MDIVQVVLAEYRAGQGRGDGRAVCIEVAEDARRLVHELRLAVEATVRGRVHGGMVSGRDAGTGIVFNRSGRVVVL